MIDPRERELLTGMVADYLNGHLSAADVARMERAAQDDEGLARELAFQTQLQASVRDPAFSEAQQYSVTPTFESIKNKLDNRARPLPVRLFDWVSDWFMDAEWARMATGVTAGFLMFAVLLAQVPGSYETLTDTVSGPTQQRVQVVASPNADKSALQALLAEQGLSALDWHTELNAVDVAVPDGLSASQLRDKLAIDSRVRFATVLER